MEGRTGSVCLASVISPAPAARFNAFALGLCLAFAIGVAASSAAAAPLGSDVGGSNAHVVATSGTAGARLPARFGHELNLVDDFGAAADATGAIGVGTDSTPALKAALSVPARQVVIPAGQYRFTSPVPMADHTNLVCQGEGATTLWFDDPTGTADFLVVDGGPGKRATVDTVSVRHCNIVRTSAARAGALIHAISTYQLTLEDNHIGADWSTRSWDNVRVDCVEGRQPVNELFFLRNYISGAFHDGVALECRSPTNVIADVFFENRNYISNSRHAAVEMAGGVGLVHFDGTDFDQNPGTALLADGTGGSKGNAYLITVHGSHFEGNGDDVAITGYSLPIFTGNEFLTKGGITCTLCAQGVSVGNAFTDDTGLQLHGVQGWTESGSHWSTTNSARPGMVQVGPSGTTPARSVSIMGGDFPFTGVPFLAFLGAASPAVGMSLGVNAGQGPCWAGSNVERTSFAYSCQGNPGPTSTAQTLRNDLGFTAPGRALMGNLYYENGWRHYRNGEAAAVRMGGEAGHSLDFIWAQRNANGEDAAASVAIGGYVADDGSLQWGTSTPCGSGCVSAGKLQVREFQPQGPIVPRRFAVRELPRCDASLYGALYEAVDASSPAYNAPVTGGGTSLVPVVCTGSQWIAH